MELFINALKGQANSLNMIIGTALLSYLFYRLNKRKTGMVLTVVALSFFVLFSTNYLPAYLTKKMESKFAPFDSIRFPEEKRTIYIHVLGAGYTDDDRLSYSAQLSLVGLGRLAEGIRILKLYKNSTLVLSGNTASGNESLASVARGAAISLGTESSRIEILETPSTTLEEANAFARRYGREACVIVVTDAVHMQRAIQFFKEQGMVPFPAPTNYFIKESDSAFALKWLPSAQNFLLMDRFLRELFGTIKGWLIGT
jgi:uncharacterized SAM-binding protein YcdF (DUF218 family)